MKYKVFDTQEQAIEEEKKISQQLGYAKAGVNAKTGVVEEGKGVTVRWAEPQQISDGRWVFPSPDEEGVEAESVWWTAPTDVPTDTDAPADVPTDTDAPTAPDDADEAPSDA